MTPKEVRTKLKGVQAAMRQEIVRHQRKMQPLEDALRELHGMCSHPDDYLASDYSGDIWWQCPDCGREDLSARCKHNPQQSARNCQACCPTIDPLSDPNHDPESPDHQREGCKICDYRDVLRRLQNFRDDE